MVGFVEFSKNCPGSLNVVPYTNSELEQPISSFGTDQMPSNIKSSSSIQLLSDSLALKTILTVYEILQWSHCGWNDVVFFVFKHISKFVP